MSNNGQVPQSIIALKADAGSSVFEIKVENCNSVQLFGVAQVLHHLAMETFAAERAGAIVAQETTKPNILTARRLPS